MMHGTLSVVDDPMKTFFHVFLSSVFTILI